ncbi:hypothetical protein LguiA_021705 [Lonicera macranthoides]
MMPLYIQYTNPVEKFKEIQLYKFKSLMEKINITIQIPIVFQSKKIITNHLFTN